MPAKNKPRVFIGSSVEGKHIAEHIQLGLQYFAEVTIWSQGVFGLSRGTLAELVKATREYDFAMLVLTPDDMTVTRGKKVNTARDNVLFELGLFMGALGRDRTFIVHPDNKSLSMPTDLAGVTPATFLPRGDGNLEAALGPVCTKLKRAITRVQAASQKGETVLRDMLRDSLQVICRTASLPQLPELAKLRAFVFRRQVFENKDCLVCYDFYDPLQAEEVIDELRFEINPKTAKKIVVVEALRTKRVIGKQLQESGEGTSGVHGQISNKVKAVVAAPIIKDRAVWGVVDFDAGTAKGARLLTSQEAYHAIHQIAKLIASLLPPARLRQV